MNKLNTSLNAEERDFDGLYYWASGLLQPLIQNEVLNNPALQYYFMRYMPSASKHGFLCALGWFCFDWRRSPTHKTAT